MRRESGSVDKLPTSRCLCICSTVAVLINVSGRKMFELNSTLVLQILTSKCQLREEIWMVPEEIQLVNICITSALRTSVQG